MEKRVVLVTVLSVVILVGWMFFVAPRLNPPRRAKPTPKPAPVAQDEEPAWAELPRPERTPTPLEPAVEPREDIVLENERLRVTLTNRGAGVRRLEVKYTGAAARRAGAGPERVALLEGFDPARAHLAVGVPDEPNVTLGFWETKVEPDRVTFRRTLRNGVELEKQFTLDPQRHVLRMWMGATNRSSEPQRLTLELHAFTGMPHDSAYRYDLYATGYAGLTYGKATSLKFVSLAEVQKADTEFKEAEIDYCGLRNRYFTVALRPNDESTRASQAAFVFSKLAGEARANAGNLDNRGVRVQLRDIAVKDRVAWDYAVFALPVAKEPLNEGPPALADGLLNYGSGCWGIGILINMVGPLLLWIMNGLFAMVGNYGLAILLLTLVVRLCVFPLSRKSMVSMSKMSELGPKMQLIKERYSDNPQKQQQEIMKMWKEHGVSPFSGCLPVLMQLPIWIGMYSVIDMSIELRHAPFMLWMGDLSEPDRLASFGRQINLLLFSMDALNVLPIIMTITWFLQSYFAPRSPDPQMAMQQKMFLFMPVVFGLMCYGLASGLSLYFFMNSLLGMAEQKIIRKIWLPPKPAKA